MITVRPRPCPTCPYRRDVPSGIWDGSEYDKLPCFDGDIPDQLAAEAFYLFFCHQRTGDLCAGWAGCHDMANTLAVRLHNRQLDPAVYDYISPVPLFASGAEAAEHGKRDLPAPGPEAVAKIGQLRKLRAARSETAAVTAAETKEELMDQFKAGDIIEHRLMPGFTMPVLETQDCETDSNRPEPHLAYKVNDPEGNEDWLCAHDVQKPGQNLAWS